MLISFFLLTINSRLSLSKDYQTIHRSIMIDLQKISDQNLLLSSDVQATEYFQQRYNQLREMHSNLEQRTKQLRVRHSMNFISLNSLSLV